MLKIRSLQIYSTISIKLYYKITAKYYLIAIFVIINIFNYLNKKQLNKKFKNKKNKHFN